MRQEIEQYVRSLGLDAYLVGGAVRILHCQMRETGIAVGALLNLAGEKIVSLARYTRSGRDIAFDLHARTGDREHRARDAGLVHGFKPHLAEIGQPGEQIGGVLGIDVAARVSLSRRDQGRAVTVPASSSRCKCCCVR